MLAARPPVVLRVTNDRGVILLDLTEFDTFEAGATPCHESQNGGGESRSN
jgi:hypothetical protein